MGAIDRRKHDIDVIERVLIGARDRDDSDDPATEVVDLGIRPWLGGTTMSAMQLTVGVPGPDGYGRRTDEPDDDPYESDRRGEHAYPGDRQRAPRSHRERDELRWRLERRG